MQRKMQIFRAGCLQACAVCISMHTHAAPSAEQQKSQSYKTARAEAECQKRFWPGQAGKLPQHIDILNTLRQRFASFKLYASCKLDIQKEFFKGKSHQYLKSFSFNLVHYCSFEMSEIVNPHLFFTIMGRFDIDVILEAGKQLINDYTNI